MWRVWGTAVRVLVAHLETYTSDPKPGGVTLARCASTCNQIRAEHRKGGHGCCRWLRRASAKHRPTMRLAAQHLEGGQQQGHRRNCGTRRGRQRKAHIYCDASTWGQP